MPKRNRHREQARALAPAGPAHEGTLTPPVASTTRPPVAVRLVSSPDEARGLATQLLGHLPWPVAVVSISAAATEPYIDATKLKSEIGDLGEVVVIPTNDVSWAFSNAMPEMTQVYGGAGRVYAPDGRWRTDPYKSPLRFAYGPSDSERVVATLAKDVAVAAFQADAAGSATSDASGITITTSTSARGALPRSGKVVGAVGDSRALVILDDGTYATIWAELTADDVEITQVAVRGQTVRGLFDPDSGRFDVRPSLRTPATALASYSGGSNILVRVQSVGTDIATLTLFPGVDVVVPRALITDNPLDRLEDLLSPAEVVVAQLDDLRIDGARSAVTATLRLDTVDDEDPVAPAPALLDGGPAWLTLPVAPAPVSPAITPERVECDPEIAPADPVDDDAVVSLAGGTIPRPRPPIAMPGPVPASQPAHLHELQSLANSNRALEAELNRLRDERDHLRTQLRTSGGKRRKAERAARNVGSAEVDNWSNVFSDPIEQFRFEVQLEWVRRIPAGQKPELPLADYGVGPAFLDSVETTPSIDRDKVVAVVVEVLTGLAADLDSREVHPLRTSRAGGAGPVTREDGAICMRVALQRGTPSARRMHYWTQGKRVELSRVVLHDDMTP